MKDYQREFIDFLVKSGALTFGDFTTKSGRKTPYFVNTGNFNTGAKLATLGKYYAAHIVERNLAILDVVFGPAYKGIPLCVATATSLHQDYNYDVGFCFNRKEVKDHGDGGSLVGSKLKDGQKVVIVEDVITAGTTAREVVPLINSFGKISILGIIISVDRSEKGVGERSAVSEVEDELGVTVYPIVTIHDIVEHLSTSNKSGVTLDKEQREKIANYLNQYGVSTK